MRNNQRKEIPKDIADMAKSLAKLVHEIDRKKAGKISSSNDLMKGKNL